jgi:hypothetical protein
MNPKGPLHTPTGMIIADRLYVDTRGNLQPIRKTPKYRESRLKSFVKGTAIILGLWAVGTLMGIMLIEWFIGCGGVTYHADHTWTTNECVVLKNTIETGVW